MTKKFNFGRVGQPFDVRWPVTVQVPQDGGTVEEETFEAVFRLTPSTELTGAALGSMGTITAIDALKKVFVGLGPDEPEPFTEKLRDDMLATDWVRAGISRSFVNCSLGIAEKNSERRPG